MLTSSYLNKEECKMKQYFSRIWTGLLITFFSFSFISSSYAIDIKLWDLSGRQGQDEFYELLQKEVKKYNPDINVIVTEWENEAYKTQIQLALNGNDGPDVFFNWFGEDSARLARAGLALDLTPYADMEGGYGNFISKGWQDAGAVDGKIYGVANKAVSKYFYYDPAFFDQHNLSVPTTFGELIDTCKSIKAIDPSIVPWPMGNSERWKLNHVITMLNQRVVGAENTKADYALTAPDDELFTNPKYVEAWEKVVELNENCFNDAPNATNPELTRSMFAAQISPMMYCGTWCGGIFASEGFTDFKMFRFPRVEGGADDGTVGFLVAEGLQVSAKTKHPEAAALVASINVSDSMALADAELRGSLISNAALIDQMKDAPHWFTFYVNDIADKSGHVNVLDVLLEANVSNAYLDMGTEVLNGTKSPQEAMDFIRKVALEAKAAM